MRRRSGSCTAVPLSCHADDNLDPPSPAPRLPAAARRPGRLPDGGLALQRGATGARLRPHRIGGLARRHHRRARAPGRAARTCRWSRRLVMVVSDLVRVLAMVALALVLSVTLNADGIVTLPADASLPRNCRSRVPRQESSRPPSGICAGHKGAAALTTTSGAPHWPSREASTIGTGRDARIVKQRAR